MHLSSAQSLAHTLLLTHTLPTWSFRFNHRSAPSASVFTTTAASSSPATSSQPTTNPPSATQSSTKSPTPSLPAPPPPSQMESPRQKLGRHSHPPGSHLHHAPGRWQATCPNCQKHFTRHRRPHRRRKYACSTCGPTKGLIQFHLKITPPAKIIQQKSSPTKLPPLPPKPPPQQPLLTQLPL